MPKPVRPEKTRLDELLVMRGLCADVEEARRRIWAGEVIVDEEMIDQPATRVAAAANVRLRSRRGRYATRGGDKLEAALAALGIEVEGACALDVGAAGGGFTDCLLAHGASRVYAVDVARGQLAQRLRLDPRVVDLGGRDVASLESDAFDPPAALAVLDVTFRSLADVLPKVYSLLAGKREIVALVKPLFEARLAGIGRHQDPQRSVFGHLLPRLREAGLPIRDVLHSTVPGSGGALEFFVHVKAPGRDDADLRRRVESAVVAGRALLSEKRRPTRSGRKRTRARRGSMPS